MSTINPASRSNPTTSVKFQGNKSLPKSTKDESIHEVAIESFSALKGVLEEEHPSFKEKNINKIDVKEENFDDDDFLSNLLGARDAIKTSKQEETKNIDEAEIPFEQAQAILETKLGDIDKLLESAYIRGGFRDGAYDMMAAKGADPHDLSRALDQRTLFIPVGGYMFMMADAGHGQGEAFRARYEDGREQSFVVQHLTEEQARLFQGTVSKHIEAKLHPSMVLAQEKDMLSDDKPAVDIRPQVMQAKERVVEGVKKEEVKKADLKGGEVLSKKQVDLKKDEAAGKVRHAHEKDEAASEKKVDVLNQEIKKEELKREVKNRGA